MLTGTVRSQKDGDEIVQGNNNIFYNTGSSTSQYGVKFIVSKKWKNYIMEFISYLDRLAVLKFLITYTKFSTNVQV